LTVELKSRCVSGRLIDWLSIVALTCQHCDETITVEGNFPNSVENNQIPLLKDAVTMEPNDRMRTMLALMGGDEGMPPAENEGGGAGLSTFPVAASAELSGGHDDHDAAMTCIPANTTVIK
jgi:hypothetical protein